MASLQPQGVPNSHPFTCNTCQVAFKSSELQRAHMQSDWHRYNLKRRVASLPPLSSEIFAEKVLASKADAAATAARASFEKVCNACQKTYYSENAFANHLASQKHRLKAAKRQQVRPGAKPEEDLQSIMSSTFSLGESAASTTTAKTEEQMDEEVEDEFATVLDGMQGTSLQQSEPSSRRPGRPRASAAEEGDRLRLISPSISASDSAVTRKTRPDGHIPKEDALRECLFCNAYAADLDMNLTHMQKAHGLFIPERNYLVDVEGLVLYLNEKVHDGYQCLSCGRLKWSEDGIKTHMRDMSHCKIAYDTEEQQLEIGQFYDFRSTYSDADEYEDEDGDEDESGGEGLARGGGVKLGAKRVATETVIIPDSEGNGAADMDHDTDDAGWETSSTVSSVPTEELGALYYDDDRDKEERLQKLRSHRHHSHVDTRKHRSVDGWHSHAHPTPHAVYHDEFELHLPTGRVAGHRSLNRYYRQNLHNYPTPAERAQQRTITAGDASSDEDQSESRGRTRARDLVSRADGGLGMISVSEAKKRQVRAMEKKERRKEGMMHAKSQWRNNKQGNFQKHFRDPLLQ